MSKAHAAWAECRIPLPGGVMVIAPPAAFGLGADSLASGFDTAERLRWLAGNSDAAARLRNDWYRLGLAGTLGRLTDRDLLSRLGSAAASHRLALAYFPRPVDPLDRINADSLPRVATPAAPVTAREVRDMSHTERVELALTRVPGHLTGALKEAFLGLISPTSLVITASTFAALGVAQLAGYGEVADAVLAAIAYEIAGLSGVRALYDMVAATVNAAMATSDAEIDASAVRLAGAFVTLGMAFLTIFLTRAARKAAQSRAASSNEAAETADSNSASRSENANRNTTSRTVASTSNARRQLARDFYQKAGWSDRRIEQHLNGIDFDKDVSVVTLRRGQVVTQWVDPNRGVGNYFADAGARPGELGFDDTGRTLQTFKVDRDVDVLQSTASPIVDTWSGPNSVDCPGGARQWFVPDNSAMIPAGSP